MGSSEREERRASLQLEIEAERNRDQISDNSHGDPSPCVTGDIDIIDSDRKSNNNGQDEGSSPSCTQPLVAPPDYYPCIRH